MSQPFQQRVFGCAIIKVINANYNADFTHQPRTLPDGTAYATDKALKYLVRNYWVNHLKGDDAHVLYYKRFNQDLKPFDLDEAYRTKFGEIRKEKGSKIKVLTNLLSCLDVRTFGATFANKKGDKMAISIHGPLQFTHGVNRFPESEIVTEQIMSPFRDDKGEKETDASTLGTQHKLAEGHFVHHFSLNPGNLLGHLPDGATDFPTLTDTDVEYVKAGLRKGATYYDSSAKAGVENELLLWVCLRAGSQIVLPSFVNLVSVERDGTIDLQKVRSLLERDHLADEIESIEVYYDHDLTKVVNIPAGAKHQEIS